MQDDKKWEAALRKLIAETEDGTLEWKLYRPDLRQDVLGEAIYGTSVMGRSLFVYEYRYKNYTDWGRDETWEWDNEVAIEFVDGNGLLRFQWPVLPDRFQLLEAIRYRVAGADEFLQAFLSGTPEDPDE